MMQEHFSSLTVGSLTGVASLAVPDGITNWLGKLATGIVIGLVCFLGITALLLAIVPLVAILFTKSSGGDHYRIFQF